MLTDVRVVGAKRDRTSAMVSAWDRRRLLVSAAGVVAATAWSGSAAAQGNFQLTEAQVLEVVDNSLWIADGEASERHVYVIYAPWCGACQGLYRRTRTKPDGLQLRWIPSGVRDAESAAYVAAAGSSRSIEALDHTFGGRRTPPAVPPTVGQNVIRLNYWTQNVASDLFKARDGRFPGYPCVLIPTTEGLRILSGAPALSVLAGATARPSAGAITPSGVALAAETVWRPGRARAAGGYSKQELAYGRALPTLAAPIVDGLARDTGGPILSVTSVNGVDWVELQRYAGRYSRGAFYLASDLHFQ